ncbi:MAG: SxtJ family membrane protein [Desulfobacterota bacterium]|nr:SxtJ family membrane protein [Thermodesulfobacteriota bacterium]
MIDIVARKTTSFIPKKISRDQAKDTGMAITLLCLLLGWFGNVRNFFAAAIVSLLITMIVPQAMNPIAKFWFGFSHLLGTIMSTIILSLMFFVIVTPIGVVRRLAGHDSLQLKKWKKGKESVFKVREHTFTASDIKHPY